MRVAIYARYSSNNQREESIDAQIRAIKEYCDNCGYSIVKTYIDEARSATTDNRPNFKNMINDSSLDIFDYVIVHKLDRFSRDKYDSVHYKRILKNNNVSVISVLERLDDSPESCILESVIESMAEYYSKNLARETMKGMKENAYKCMHTGGKPPLGYDVDPLTKKYIINEEEAKSVRLIFKLYANGSGYISIVRELNSLGYKTKIGNSFSTNSIAEILRNEKYTGLYVFNKTPKKINGKRNSHITKPEEEIIRIKDGMPRIVSDETYNKVQERLQNNKRNASNKAKETYILSGKIKCGICGSAMIGHTSKCGRNKNKYSTYRCGRRYRYKDCKMKPINRDYVDEIVLNNLTKHFFSDSSINKLTKELTKTYNKSLKNNTSNLKNIERDIKSIDKEIDNLVIAIANGLNHPSIKTKLDTLESEKSNLSILKTELEYKLNNSILDEKLIREYLLKDSLILKSKSADDLKHIINTYIDSVIIYEDKVEIDLIFVHINGGGEGSCASIIS
ncbi:recombinase family protein [Clostridium tertium]